TGYSSLAYLKRLPIHELKIDKTFIRDLTFDSADVILVRTILGIARQFHLDVVAEGVETYEQYALLCDMGCRFFQGYFLSRPVPSAAL
ncbi:MAG: EAL domain-containing protein, partial [Epsilonproteobacteria bacterium]|nr:EAL domain-containing protein [Campylobacterota bacterium]